MNALPQPGDVNSGNDRSGHGRHRPQTADHQAVPGAEVIQENRLHDYDPINGNSNFSHPDSKRFASGGSFGAGALRFPFSSTPIARTALIPLLNRNSVSSKLGRFSTHVTDV